MIKRARIWLLIALIGGFFGFTGVLHSTAVLAQDLFYLCSAFAVLSVLFSLFEEQGEPTSVSQETTMASVVPLHDFVRQRRANPEAGPSGLLTPNSGPNTERLAA